MGSLIALALSLFSKLTPIAAVDILLTAFLIYQFLLIIKGRRAAQILAGITFLVLLYLFALSANLELLRTLLATIAPYTAFGIVVMFQSEIRRMLAQIGRRGWMGFGGRLQRREFVDEILAALEQLSRTRTGALIVLERYSGLRSFVESGVALDAMVSTDLLLAIFIPKGPLHDGAVIIQQTERIAAAACFLPLSMNPALMSALGTRHRAGIGVTEESDAMALIVSEETGSLSVASFGKIERDLTIQEVDAMIGAHIGGRNNKDQVFPPEEPAPQQNVSNAEERAANRS